jgi:hypothetical protein
MTTYNWTNFNGGGGILDDVIFDRSQEKALFTQLPLAY